MNWIEKCDLIGNLYRIAREELSTPSGTTWSNSKSENESYTYSPSLRIRSSTKRNLEKEERGKKKRKTTTTTRMTSTVKSLPSPPLMATRTKTEKATVPRDVKTLPQIGHSATTASASPASAKNSAMSTTKERNGYNNPIIDLYVDHMDSLRNMTQPNHHDVRVLTYDKWNAAVRCDRLIVRMVLLGGVLTVYEPETGITLRRASCHRKSLVKTFDPVERKWNSGCFHSFLEIERALARRSDVTEIGISLSEIKEQSTVGVINHLLGKNDVKKKVISIWSRTDEKRPPPVIPFDFMYSA
uniref:Wsv134-like protein n=1 Tax=Penaeus semisulcatus majanivirus TaxID=2984274 RepID=A0A9C7BZ26_9VIRU|nr:MAG: wsv134-like protein [Penaeus semisulcatus majanivirus]